MNAVGAVVAATAALVGTLLAVRVVLLEGRNGFGDLATGLQVFPEGNLVAVNDHLVVRFVQLTTKLDQGHAGVAVRAAARTVAAGLQVVNVGDDKVLVVQGLNVAEVHLTSVEEHGLEAA